jgi:hypothetical protein
MELQLVYVRDKAPAVHIWDYLKDRPDHALCGHAYQDPLILEDANRPRSVCGACQALSPKAEAIYWRAIAEELQEYPQDYEELWADYELLRAEYDSLWTKYEKTFRDYEYYLSRYESLRAKTESPRAGGYRNARTPSRYKQKVPRTSNRNSRTGQPSKQGKDTKKRKNKVNPSRRPPSGRRRVRFVG